MCFCSVNRISPSTPRVRPSPDIRILPLGIPA